MCIKLVYKLIMKQFTFCKTRVGNSCGLVVTQRIFANSVLKKHDMQFCEYRISVMFCNSVIEFLYLNFFKIIYCVSHLYIFHISCYPTKTLP